MDKGDYFASQDEDSIVIGFGIAQQFKLNLMDELTIRGRQFPVKGILKETGGKDDVAVFMPISVARCVFSCIIGPSGHGKSTLMHLIGGLDRPTEGRVFIDGSDITGLSNSELAALRARMIGFVFQFFNLLPNLTAEENVETAMMFSGNRDRMQKGKARELLSLVGLSEKLNAKPSELSGGQQQRVAIARALANDPEILLMDEPTGNLDSESEAEVLNAIFKLHKERKTVVIVTHNNEIAKKAEIVFEIRDGRLKSSS
ncbi:MAG: ABC transporter ATP-binding protein [Thermodesulfovibrionales bacterium]|jgi:putative ABC transport system ATP-binding protein|nr:ABC transporter ATP-binding protein [Thermodesulfovibrionales bacterium]